MQVAVAARNAIVAAVALASLLCLGIVFAKDVSLHWGKHAEARERARNLLQFCANGRHALVDCEGALSTSTHWPLTKAIRDALLSYSPIRSLTDAMQLVSYLVIGFGVEFLLRPWLKYLDFYPRDQIAPLHGFDAEVGRRHVRYY